LADGKADSAPSRNAGMKKAGINPASFMHTI
jgi:hypothetical protein